MLRCDAIADLSRLLVWALHASDCLLCDIVELLWVIAVRAVCLAPSRLCVGREQTHFQRLQRGSWDDAQFANGAEAMSAVLELVRRHQARQPPSAYKSCRPCQLAATV